MPKRRSGEEKYVRRIRRHTHLRQIKGRYVHREEYHGPFFFPGDALLKSWLAALSGRGTVLVASDQRHLKMVEEAGYRALWHLERKPPPDDVLLGLLPRPPNATGSLARLKFTAPLAGAFVCSRVQKQDDLRRYLVALRECVAPGAPIALAVPNAHHELVDDHVHLFTAGTLIYALVRAGWNCKEARVDYDGRFLNVLVRRVDLPEPWPQLVDETRPYTPFRATFQYCSSEYPEVYRKYFPAWIY